MRAFLAMIAQLAFVLFAGVLAVQVATETLGSPISQNVKLDVSAEGLWTNVPMKVANAQHQAFERLPVPPDPYPFKFRADGRWRPCAAGSRARAGRGMARGGGRDAAGGRRR